MGEPPSRPRGVTERKDRSESFGYRFKSTIMGTALFVAEMQRKVPLRTKLLIGVLVLVAGGLGGWAWVDYRTGEEARERLVRALAEPHDNGVAAVRTLLAEGHLDSDSMRDAVAYLGEARDAESVPQLIEAVRSGPSEVVRAAAIALARIGRPSAAGASDALAARLAQAEPSVVVPLAWGLASLGDERGIEVTIEGLASGTLQELDSYDPAKLAELLGRDGLVERLGHPHPAVRQFVVRWLGEHCEPGLTPALVGATRDEDESVAVSASVSLARCDAPAARDAIPGVLRSSPQVRGALTVAFASEVGAPGLGILLSTEGDLDKRRALIERIAKLHDPRAGDELMQELDRTAESESRHRLDIAMALAEISDPRTPVVIEPFLDEGDAWTEQAIDVLGASGLGEEISDLLVDLTRRHRNLRSAALRAMGRAGACTESALRVMRSAARSRDTQAAALEGLARCGDDSAPELALRELRRVPRGRPTASEGELALAAYDAVARLRVREGSEVLLEQVLDGGMDPRLRMAAADALGLAGSDADLERAVDRALDRETSPRVRATLFRALRHRVPSSAIPRLMGYVRGGEDNERTLGAAAVLGHAARAALQSELSDLLQDDRARKIAALTVALGGNDESARRLVILMRRDPNVDGFVRAQGREEPLLVGHESFESGSIYRRIEHYLRLRDLSVGAFWDELGRALGEGASHPGGWTGRQIRRAFTADLESGDGRRQRLAAEALAAMGARGTLLAARSRGGPSGAVATAALR